MEDFEPEVGNLFQVRKPLRIFMLFLGQTDLWKAAELLDSQLLRQGLGVDCSCDEFLLEVTPMPHPNGLNMVIRRFWHMKLKRVGWFRHSDLQFLDRVYPK